MNAIETTFPTENTTRYGDDEVADESQLPFEFGTILEDPNTGCSYTLLDFLGSGSYAVVYLAKDNASGEDYAIKCLSKRALSDDMLELQQIEVDIHSSLSHHKNIVKMESSFSKDEWLFIVMEYCDGEDLFSWISRDADYETESQFDNPEAERISTIKHVFDQVLDAVLFCHQNGVFHRDLKPENFMITYDGVVKLTDFGLATTEDYSTDYECGSKPYLSYESRNFYRAPYSSRQADIWSLGIIFLNLLYHQCPWTDPSAGECDAFAAFMKDKIGFLKMKFDCPNEVAEFLATQVFCLESDHGRKGRINLLQWKCWCADLEKNYAAFDSEFSVHDGCIEIPANKARLEVPSFSFDNSHQSTWSEVFDEEEEMDFNEPVLFEDVSEDHDYDSAYGSFSVKGSFSHDDDIAAALEDEFGTLMI